MKTTLRYLFWGVSGFSLGLVLYVVSSGPVLATSFWLREATGWDGWYATLYLYYPLLIWGHDNFIDTYIEFWVRLFGTVGPG